MIRAVTWGVRCCRGTRNSGMDSARRHQSVSLPTLRAANIHAVGSLCASDPSDDRKAEIRFAKFGPSTCLLNRGRRTGCAESP
jgi:hypothetical protein